MSDVLRGLFSTGYVVESENPDVWSRYSAWLSATSGDARREKRRLKYWMNDQHRTLTPPREAELLTTPRDYTLEVDPLVGFECGITPFRGSPEKRQYRGTSILCRCFPTEWKHVRIFTSYVEAFYSELGVSQAALMGIASDVE